MHYSISWLSEDTSLTEHIQILYVTDKHKFQNVICCSSIFKIHNGRKLKIDVTNPSKSECIEMAL